MFKYGLFQVNFFFSSSPQRNSNRPRSRLKGSPMRPECADICCPRTFEDPHGSPLQYPSVRDGLHGAFRMLCLCNDRSTLACPVWPVTADRAGEAREAQAGRSHREGRWGACQTFSFLDILVDNQGYSMSLGGPTSELWTWIQQHNCRRFQDHHALHQVPWRHERL